MLFNRVLGYLQHFESLLSKHPDGLGSSLDDQLPNAVAYLNFLRCSYWLPSEQPHFVSPNLVQTLCNFVGIDGLDSHAHDVLSALLSLLHTPTSTLLSYDGEKPASSNADSPSAKPQAHEHLIQEQLFVRFQGLHDQYFASDSGRTFRTWFQWVNHTTANYLDLQAIYTPLYWSRLRSGLLSGFGEQRKYCLGILRQSILSPRQDIDTPLMTLKVAQRSAYQLQYERYSSLFETIVLDRYPNQVQACLPELTNLLSTGSLISQSWVTTLLSAVLNSKVQDGVRKLVGTWYVDFVTKKDDAFATESEERAFFDAHAHFLVEGFLPWATQGSLFTSSLRPSRQSTTCEHGEALAQVISRFIVAVSDSLRLKLLDDILCFILDRGGKIFHHSIMYILQGILQGFRSQALFVDLDAKDFENILRVSRLTGLPEIASDLCTTYCAVFCQTFYFAARGLDPAERHKDISGFNELSSRYKDLLESHVLALTDRTSNSPPQQSGYSDMSALQIFSAQLEESGHKSIQGEKFVSACNDIIQILDNTQPETLDDTILWRILEALWEEGDRQEYCRTVVCQIPPLFFHPRVIQVCGSWDVSNPDEQGLPNLLNTALERLGQLAAGKTYLLSTLLDSLRKGAFSHPNIVSLLPFEDIFLQFIEKPPSPKKEFLFEVAAAEKLETFFEHRNYSSYYGKREWHAYAALIDLINRIPNDQLEVAKRVLDRLIEPWRTQKKPVPIISKWKETFQLQAMLLLSESCISQADADWYLNSFMYALNLEQWPRYRYLLEWIISRIYYRYPKLADRILPDLARLSDTAPIQIASLMKLAVLAAPFLNSEDFALQLMTQLIPFSASPKVHIRHEAHWSFPIVFELAEKKQWPSITGNPAFKALNSHIRSLDKFKSPASTIRTLRLDAVEDFTLVNIFQGDYLTIETPERELVSYDDFANLWEGDKKSLFDTYHVRIPLGIRKPGDTEDDLEFLEETGKAPKPDFTTAPLQTKSGFELASLLPSAGLPSATPSRPASVILVASLIDNPTNLGGLSRISESFGLTALYINSLTHLASKDFQSTAVTSHKHLPIHELAIGHIPAFIIDMKRKGYEIVAIEQTDRSGMLGEENGDKDVGTLPKRCVLVLGSEKGGVTTEVLAVVDRCVEIKTVGVTRSLNVQTAGGIAVYEWWREWGSQC
jgi:tRNA guanosine-2'-O-methyltransferase